MTDAEVASPEPSVPEDPRVRFAAERTLLAWIRTGLSMMGFGFVVARFGVFLREIAGISQTNHQPPSYSLWIGSGLVALGVAVNIFAALGHLQFLKRLNAGLPFKPSRYSLPIIAALILAAAGVAMFFYLISFPNSSAPARVMME